MASRGYTPLQTVLIALNKIIDSSGLSLREVARKAEKDGLNLSNVCAVANGNPEQLSSIVKFDQYVDKILRVTGHDDKDLILKTLDTLNKVTYSYQGNLSKELKEFLRNPESERYIRYAYNKYKLDKLEEEREILKKEMEDI